MVLKKKKIKKSLTNKQILFKNSLKYLKSETNYYEYLKYLLEYKQFFTFNKISKKKQLVKKIINKCKNIHLKYNYTFVSFFDILQNLSNFLLFNKLSNLLMSKGKKYKAELYLLKMFEILKTEYHIPNPFDIFKYYIYINLVPHIEPKTIKLQIKGKIKKNMEKVIGIYLEPHYRLNYSLKMFIKGAREIRSSIAYSLVAEFFSLISGDSYLHKYNIDTFSSIQKNKLIDFNNYKKKKYKISNKQVKKRYSIFRKKYDL